MGYDTLVVENAKVIGKFIDDESVGIVTDVTPFYAEMGGEVGDTGTVNNELFEGEVVDCIKLPNGQHMMKVNVLKGEVNIDDFVTLKVDNELRNKIQANHTATHLLDQALKEENAAQKNKIYELQKMLLKYKVESVPENEELVVLFDSELEGNGPRELMNMLLEKNTIIAAVFAGNDSEGYRYVCGSKTVDMRPIAKTLNGKFNGRGGGKPEMVQGSLRGCQKEIEEALFACKEQV